jgi:hypothetical protein
MKLLPESLDRNGDHQVHDSQLEPPVIFLETAREVLRPSPEGGFLFATFKGESSPLTEQVYFGLSEDGRHWQALNGGEPVLVSTLGERGVRDPFLIRSHDREKFWLLATDLCIHLNPNWGRAEREGSRSIVIWESSDLVNWSAPRLVPLAAPDAGCTWAPEAVYDEDCGDYLVFWASTNARDDFAKQRIWASRTKNFQTFGEAFVYIDKPHHVIDTDIVPEGERYFRFSKDEQIKAITLERSDRLMGPWEDMPHFSLAALEGYEGPQCFRLDEETWCLLLDYYIVGKGYQPFLTHDLAGGQFSPASDFSFPFRFRHGSVLRITTVEFERLVTAFGKPIQQQHFP